MYYYVLTCIDIYCFPSNYAHAHMRKCADISPCLQIIFHNPFVITIFSVSLQSQT